MIVVTHLVTDLPVRSAWQDRGHSTACQVSLFLVPRPATFASSSGHRDLLGTGRHRVASASGGPLLEPPPGTGTIGRSANQPAVGRQGSVDTVCVNPVLWVRLVKNVEVVETRVALHERT